MNASIQSVIKEWETAKGHYSFGTRIHPVLGSISIMKDTPYINLYFIIDVVGFSLDKGHNQPVKFHHERVISIDGYSTDPQYINDFRQDLNLFTATAYEQFEKILSTLPQTIFTSDALFMK